ncbi:hypothetical protein [Streptomyces sp. NPDC051109]|uniref:hypothetical protein n=1 Tax=Streptomyces sp. NPDC051109 TaxID=3365642 RepID=UPI003787BC18
MHDDLGVHAVDDASPGDGFAVSLERFASALSPSEHTILIAALNAATEPWMRMAARPVEELLEPEEAQLLDHLVKRPPVKEHEH